jgi:hypothetical protein
VGLVRLCNIRLMEQLVNNELESVQKKMFMA